MGRIVRYIIFLVVILVFLAATAVTVTSGGSVGVVLAALVAAVLTLPQNLEWFWDRLGPARNLRPTVRDTQTEPGTIEEYLNGKLREFADEERRFVPLALAITPAYQEAKGEPTEDIARLFREKGGRLALIGDPGAGKSTTLRHLMRQAIADYKANPETSRIPVWINLGEGANPVNGDDLLLHWWDTRCFLPGSPERFVRQHRLLLLFDGLNEMPLDTRDERAAALREFLTTNTEVQAIVTCRVRDYEDDEVLKLPLPAVRVLPLDDTRVQDFIARNGGDNALWPLIRANDALRTLAANPYNLYQLVQIYADNQRTGKTEALPSDLNTLYRRYVEVAYNRYTRERTDKRDAETPLLQLPLPKLESRLKRLAFAMLAEGKGTSADLEWALHWRRRWRWGQQAIMDGINLGVLLGDGQNLRFYHQSLHGYFAVEPLSRALTINGRFDRLVKRPIELIRQLGELGITGAPAVDPLIDALGDLDKEVQYSATNALIQIGEPTVNHLIHSLYNKRSEIRGNAAIALGNIRNPLSIEPLVGALGDADMEVNWKIINALVALGDMRAVDPLIASLSNNDSNARAGAIFVLGTLKDNRVIDPLISALNDSEWIVRSSAAIALGIVGSSKAVLSLVSALNDPEWAVRASVADALGILGDNTTIEPLIKSLYDRDARVRLNIVNALGNLRDIRAVEPLINLMNESDVRLRSSVVSVLGHLIDVRAIEPLIRALGDTDIDVRRNAADALERIGTPEALSAVQAWRKNLTP